MKRTGSAGSGIRQFGHSAARQMGSSVVGPSGRPDTHARSLSPIPHPASPIRNSRSAIRNPIFVAFLLLFPFLSACRTARPPGYPQTAPPETRRKENLTASMIRVGLLETADPVEVQCPQGCKVMQGPSEVRHLGKDETLRVIPILQDSDGASTTPAGIWIQVAALQDRSQAEALRDRLRQQFPEGPGWHVEAFRDRWRVRAGPWTDEATARAFLRRLQQDGYEGWLDRGNAVSARRTLSALQLVASSWVGTVPADRPLEITADSALTWRGQRYPGTLRVMPLPDGKVALVNVLPLELYLVGVLVQELNPQKFPALEALKAQAVAARTYAVRNRNGYANRGYDICATPACQVYAGVPEPEQAPLAYTAVAETRGEVLTYGGEPIQAFYTSTCGGHTDSAEFIFPRFAAPYLQGVPCPDDTGAAAQTVEGAPMADLWASPSVARGFVPWVHEARLWPIDGTLSEAARWERWADIWANLLRSPSLPDGTPRASDGGDSPRRPAPSSMRPPTRRQLLQALGRPLQDPRWDDLLLPSDTRVLDRLAQGLQGDLDGDFRRGLLWLLLMAPDIAARWLDGGVDWQKPVRFDEWLSVYGRLRSFQAPPDVSEAVVLDVRDGRLRLQDPSGRLWDVAWGPFTVVLQRWGDTWLGGWALLGPGDRLQVVVHGDHLDYIESSRPTGWVGTADRNSLYAWWTVELDGPEVVRRLRSACPAWEGDLRRVIPLQITPYGRVVHLRFVSSTGQTCELQGLSIRTVLGLRELRFRVWPVVGPDGNVQRLLIVGRGWGHGVGLCQTGAFGMALRGLDYRAILQHYYPGTRIERQDK